jgi:hypothetical protein
MRRTPNRGEGIVTYFALVNKSGKSTLISIDLKHTFGNVDADEIHEVAKLIKIRHEGLL